MSPIGAVWEEPPQKEDTTNICPKCGHSGELHILVMWEYFLCHEKGCGCKQEWRKKK